MMTTTPRSLRPLHEAHDAAKLQALTDAMRRDGWTGRPVLALDDHALTGSHRLAAAVAADLTSVPVYRLESPPCDEDGDAPEWVSRLMDARDDEERLAVLLSVDREAADLMAAEIDASA